jgi:hypothetical protein
MGPRICYRRRRVGNELNAFLDPYTGVVMAWRVATRPGKPTLEVISQQDWNAYSTEKQAAFQSVKAFATEQEADRFARGRVDAAKLEAAKPGR